MSSLEWISNFFLKAIGIKINILTEKFFNNIHRSLNISNLNDFRMDIINKINSSKSFREKFYKVSKSLVDMVVGNEVVMQKSEFKYTDPKRR